MKIGRDGKLDVLQCNNISFFSDSRMDLSFPSESSASEIQVEICKAVQLVTRELQLQSYCSDFAQSSLEKEVNHVSLSLHVEYSIKPLLRHWVEVKNFIDDSK